jgi:armadillo repeat-containing protein 6
VYAPEIVANLLAEHKQSSDLVKVAAEMCLRAGTECEEAMCRLMESEYPQRALDSAQDPALTTEAAAALLTSLQALITNDDHRPPASKAFVHARLLAVDKGAVPVFMHVLRRCLAEAGNLRPVVLALQQLCANDAICKQVRLGLYMPLCISWSVLGEGWANDACFVSTKQLAVTRNLGHAGL